MIIGKDVQFLEEPLHQRSNHSSSWGFENLTPEARTKTSKRSAFNFNDEKTISTQDENDNWPSCEGKQHELKTHLVANGWYPISNNNKA